MLVQKVLSKTTKKCVKNENTPKLHSFSAITFLGTFLSWHQRIINQTIIMCF